MQESYGRLFISLEIFDEKDSIVWEMDKLYDY